MIFRLIIVLRYKCVSRVSFKIIFERNNLLWLTNRKLCCFLQSQDPPKPRNCSELGYMIFFVKISYLIRENNIGRRRRWSLPKFWRDVSRQFCFPSLNENYWLLAKSKCLKNGKNHISQYFEMRFDEPHTVVVVL